MERMVSYEKHIIRSQKQKQESDYTLILGITVFYASILVFIMFIIDIIYGLVDPRIRLDKDN